MFSWFFRRNPNKPDPRPTDPEQSETLPKPLSNADLPKRGKEIDSGSEKEPESRAKDPVSPESALARLTEKIRTANLDPAGPRLVVLVERPGGGSLQVIRPVSNASVSEGLEQGMASMAAPENRVVFILVEDLAKAQEKFGRVVRTMARRGRQFELTDTSFDVLMAWMKSNG